MAGAVSRSRLSDDRGVTRAVDVSLARPADEPDLRRLLAETPLGGRPSLAFTREPDAFAADFGLAERHDFVVARDGATGRAVGLAERLVFEMFVAGRRRHVPYLGALRLTGEGRGSLSVLRRGFGLLRALARPDETAFALTSITADNAPALRLLTRGLPGLPLYRPLAAYATLALRPRADARARAAVAALRPDDVDELAAFLGTTMKRRDFALVWNTERLARLLETGTGLDDVLVLRRDGRIAGSVVVWDQRSRRQARIVRWPRGLALARPVLNAAAPLLGLPHLPREGAVLNQAVLTALALADDCDVDGFETLLAAGLDRARARGHDVAVLGLPTGHPWEVFTRRRYRAMSYRTLLHLAHWSDAAEDAPADAATSVFPDVGVL